MRRLATVLNSGRTLLLTTHRMTLLRMVDRLIILDRGLIIADGPRDEILRRLKEGQIASAETHGRIANQQTESDAALSQPPAALPGDQSSAPTTDNEPPTITQDEPPSGHQAPSTPVMTVEPQADSEAVAPTAADEAPAGAEPPVPNEAGNDAPLWDEAPKTGA